MLLHHKETFRRSICIVLDHRALYSSITLQLPEPISLAAFVFIAAEAAAGAATTIRAVA